MSRFPTGTLIALLLASASAVAIAAAPDETCSDCHGKDGASTESDIPVIGGQSQQYLIDTMAAYRDKKRPCPESAYRAGDKKRPKVTMCQVAAKLGDATAVAKDLSGEPFVRAKQPFDAAQAAIGKKLHSQTCEKCHSEGGSSTEDDSGILAGQWTPYLKQTLSEMMTGKRPIPQKMKVKTDALKPGDVEALLNYYASQQ